MRTKLAAKSGIVERGAENALLLPELIIRGLAANDRLKYYLTLLQAADAHARSPHQPAPTLRLQREASGVEDAYLDHTVEGSAQRGGHTYIPGAGTVVVSLFEELRLMMQPLTVAALTRSDLRSRVEIYQRRFDDLVAHAPSCVDDQLAAGAVTALTRLTENGHDTLHRLVIDLQWELNRLQTTVSFESIDGARAYEILPAERRVVRAFMRGINETAALKFDHPGLVTIAAHDGDRLTIQNDLGMTPSHTVVVHAAGLAATVTYTDVHHARVVFLQELLAPYDVQWAGPVSGAGTDAEVLIGRYTADSPETFERYLAFLGSRLVFLIDWNRARKRLARLVGKQEAVALLKWAADNGVGHMGFLKAGDVRLVESAIERAMPLRRPTGGRLDEWLGADTARSFLRTVLETTTSMLRAGQSLAAVDDAIDGELVKHLQATGGLMFGNATTHADMISTLADRARRTLMGLAGGEHRDADAAGNKRAAQLAHTWTNDAEQIVRQALRWESTTGDSHLLNPLWRDADHAAEALEETAFLLTLVTEAVGAKSLTLLAALAEVMDLTVREYARCLDESRALSAASHRAEVDGFLLTIDRLVDLGRQARDTKRMITERLLHAQVDVRELYLVASIASGFERAVAALARCGPIVREYVLSRWVHR
jgi:hypothetical protein